MSAQICAESIGFAKNLPKRGACKRRDEHHFPENNVHGGGGGGVHFGRGIISRGNFVFKEGGDIFPWRNLGVSAVYCRCSSFEIPRGGELPPPPNSPQRNNPHT